jgi:hypothetical protein
VALWRLGPRAGEADGRSTLREWIANGSPMIEVQEGQRAIAVHALENLAMSDTGFAMLRRTLREQIKRASGGLDPMNVIRDEQLNRRIPTNAWNTILSPTDASALQGEGGVTGKLKERRASFPQCLENDTAQLDRHSRIEPRRQTGRMVSSYRALSMDTPVWKRRVKGVTRSVESAVNTQFSGATLTEMMDCSSELALRTGDQLECAGKAEQDRQQRPHLQPVKQQANRFETHFSLPRGLGPLQPPPSGRSVGPRNRGWAQHSANPLFKENLAAVDFNQIPVNTVSSQLKEGVFGVVPKEAVPFGGNPLE